MLISRCILCLFSVLLTFAQCAAQTITPLTSESHELLRRLPFCRVGKSTGVPPELIAGVVTAENQLNLGWKDTLQDAFFEALLSLRDDNWWSRWAKHSLHLANQAGEARWLSNKWSADVMATGVVVSIGRAQITPRTALLACASSTKPFAICTSGEKEIVRGLLNERTAIELAGIVLEFEARNYETSVAADNRKNFALWATLYNFGGDYYRWRNRDKLSDQPANRFGKWVANTAPAIKRLIGCES